MDGESKMPAPDDIVDALSTDGFDAEALRDHALRSLERDPYTDDGGES